MLAYLAVSGPQTLTERILATAALVGARSSAATLSPSVATAVGCVSILAFVAAGTLVLLLLGAVRLIVTAILAVLFAAATLTLTSLAA